MCQASLFAVDNGQSGLGFSLSHLYLSSESLRGRIVPPQVAAIRSQIALCPKIGKKFSLEDHSAVLLVPPEFFRRESANH